MKLSTRSRYGVKIILELALAQNRPLFLREIAAKHKISEKYLSKIIIPLKAYGLIRSIRGAKGGYLLSKKPYEINMKECVEVLEGEINIAGKEPSDESSEYCPVSYVWEGLNRVMSEYLEKITIEDIADEYRRMKSGERFTYRI